MNLLTVGSKNVVNPPSVEAMARDLGPISEEDAMAYAQGLPEGSKRAVSGCYILRCARSPCVGCPIGCAYQCSLDGCFCSPISTIPFLCCVCLCLLPDKGYYRNAKGDTLMMKVDQHNETLACYTKGCGSPCCFCNKSC